LNTATPKTNGKFKYLSVTGKRMHELEYEKGHLKSFGRFKDSSQNNSGIRTKSCVHWYWVTTVYDKWGNIWYQSSEYYGTTCQGEDCQDPYNAMLCPMDYGGEGGPGDFETWEFL